MKKTYIITFAVILCLIMLFFYSKYEKVYISEEYNQHGKLAGTNEYVIRDGETIVHGKFVNYNEQGNKIAEGQFVDGHVKGKCTYYFDNGKIESVHYRKNSKITEESTFYNSDGLIRKYIMYSDIGEPKFIINFDGKTVINYDGYAIFPVNQCKLKKEKKYKIYTGDTLKVGDIIMYDYLIANIPNTKRAFKILNEDIDNSKAKRIIRKEGPTHLIVEEVLTKKGLNRIKAITQYTFDDNVTRIKNDTVSFDVNVK